VGQAHEGVSCYPSRMQRFGRCLLLALMLGVFFLPFSGCGYRNLLAPLVETDAEGASRPARLALVSLRNDSPEPWLDRIVSGALRRELGLRRRFVMVTDPGAADLVVRGRIRPLVTRSNSFSSFVAALEYRVRLTLDLEIVSATGDIVRLDSRALSETDIYLASPDVEVTRSNRLEALRHLSDLLATRIADSLEWIEISELAPESLSKALP